MKEMYKKGQANHLFHNAIRIGFMVFALLAFFILLNFYVNSKVEVQFLQSEALLNRILYSDAIMYSDTDTSRVYPGIIDMAKFNDANLDSSISYGDYKRHAAAKLKLLSKIPDAQGSLWKADAYLNKQHYDNMKPLLGKGGKGAAQMYITHIPVTYLENGKYDYGTLVVEIIIPNS
jgi:hypothetical protein